MKRKIFLSIFLCSFFSLILAVFCMLSAVYSENSKDMKKTIQSEAGYISYGIEIIDENEENLMKFLNASGMETATRVTYIDSQGNVIYDSVVSENELDNHSQRPEIIQAIKNGEGSATRASDTIGNETYYYAIKLGNNNILRVSCETKSYFGLLGNVTWFIVLILFAIIFLSLAMAYILTNSIIKPINQLDLNNPLANDTYDELSPLLARMKNQNIQIKHQIEKLSQSKEEFDYITSNMSEGLLIISKEGNVVSANKSVRKILSENTKGSYLEMYRDSNFIESVEKSLEGDKAECHINKNGRIYNISANPVNSGNGKFASVIFIVDITEREQADTMRREFSANVSHELKTPLTSIMGYAEIISNGIAKEKDIPHFAGMIHSESSRLLSLIEDIIKISQLDENSQLKEKFENINISDVCREVIEQLQIKADKSEISLDFIGKDAFINGFKPVIHEMIYNLCDNAVRYNKKGGKAEIIIEENESEVLLKVSDNGIGIASEHHSRVFERFYRVDKSHSKATGGTGLGLSIVRHGTMLHNAELTLKSEVNVGTEICISFRK